jgi:hypothetical protein
LENEANHILASLAAMTQPALVAAGVMVPVGLRGASMTVEGAGSMGQTGCYPPAARFGIAGRGIARVDGLREAYRTACRMARRRT